MISEQKKCIFIHIPKCAGSSVKNLLRGHNKLQFEKDDWHYTIEQLNNYLINNGKELDSYFTFCLTRNPFDRFVSAFSYTVDKILDKDDYHWNHYKYSYEIIEKHIFPSDKINSFRNFVKHADFRHLFYNNKLPIHFKKQYDFISVNDKIIIDHVGKVESIQDSFNLIASKLNIQSSYSHVNQSSHNSYKNFYDSETSQIIREAYDSDFYNLGYRKTI